MLVLLLAVLLVVFFSSWSSYKLGHKSGWDEACTFLRDSLLDNVSPEQKKELERTEE